ncbi:MAG: hypothetical protein R6X06_09125 [Gammaproteobacteria bacterium]
MSDNHLWYGYLEAGTKSTPVLLDHRLNTGDPKTLYLFNLKRGEILEYKREIIEPKLRDLNEHEKGLSTEIKSAFNRVRVSFIPRGGRASNLAEQGKLSDTRAANDDIRADDSDCFADLLGNDEDEDALDDVWEEEEA